MTITEGVPETPESLPDCKSELISSSNDSPGSNDTIGSAVGTAVGVAVLVLSGVELSVGKYGRLDIAEAEVTLPEVETIARDLAPRLNGRTLRNPRLFKTNVLREVSARRLLG